MTTSGYFILSLDTELSVGFFDLERERQARFSQDGQAERSAIRSILSLCEKYDIAATWAITGFIFHERGELPLPCPLETWQEEFNRHAAAYDTASPLSYGADIIQEILNSPHAKEIGFHGYTHRPFPTLEADEAQFELDEWKRLAAKNQITGTSVVFPRNAICHLDRIRDSGFLCYRGHDLIPRPSEFFPILEVFDHLLPVSKLPVYDINTSAIDASGLVNLPGSQHLFYDKLSVENTLVSLNLHKRRMKRIFKGIETAAAEGKMVHLWAHPWEFRNPAALEILDNTLSYVAQKSAQGSLRSVTMTEMAQIILDQTAHQSSR
jgi:hypothetical protein